MIKISDNAQKQIQLLMNEEGKPNSFLRVQVQKGGCSGLSYKLDFTEESREKDQIIEVENIKVLIDPKSLMFVAGMTLDYSGGLNGSGFGFENPNASKTCGCGSSFAV